MLRLFVLLTTLGLTTLSHASVGQFLYETNRSMEAWLAGLEKHTRQVGDTEWHYYTRNLNKTDCTVLVHGFTAEAAHWFRFARKLLPSRCLIIPDLPGFGESSYDPANDYHIPRQTKRLDMLLQAVKPTGKLHLMGSSMGGHIVATYTLNFPQRVASLTLFNAAGVASPEKPYATEYLERTGKPVFHIQSMDDFEHLTRVSMTDAPWMPGMVLDYIGEQFIQRNERHMRIFGQIFDQDRLDDQLQAVTIPTLVVWGSDDQILDKSMGEQYTALIPGAEQHVMPQLGHLPFLEAPAKSAAIVERFLSEK